LQHAIFRKPAFVPQLHALARYPDHSSGEARA
jgi:hypothetical protein